MTILDLKEYKPICTEAVPPLVLCLGTFDGVHRGHAALIEETRRQADRIRAEIPDVRAGAWCFAVPPRRYMGGGRAEQITSLREKLDLMAAMGLDYVCLGDFSSLRHMDPECFLRDVLQDECHCVSTVCGFNHRFGRAGTGTPADMKTVFGDHARIMDPVNDVRLGVVISSSRIRSLLTAGRMAEAVRLMGHPFLLRAPVMHGKALGRTIGLPTVNQNFPAGHIIPACGIYATRVRIKGEYYLGVTNVGKRPTVEDSDRINCETHILDFNGSLYGEVITTEFYTKLRDEKRFESLAALTEAIRADADAARSYFASGKGAHA